MSRPASQVDRSDSIFNLNAPFEGDTSEATICKVDGPLATLAVGALIC